MEIKTTLNKPYSEEECMDFIVKNNHQLGYEIRETETELQAWGLTEEETMQEEKKNTANRIKQKLYELDLKRIRAVCENGIKDETTGESWLEFYNKQISELRDKLSSI